MNRPSVIACDVFADELRALGVGDAEVAWLEMGLHDHPESLRAEVARAIADIEERRPETDAILLAYGLCGNGLLGVRAGRVPLVLPRAHDCVSVLLGGADRHAAVLAENPGTYFYSPGWIRGRRVPGPDREAGLRDLYAGRHPDDPELVEDLIEADRETFAHHSRAAYVDLTGDTRAEDYCRECARHLGWEFKRLDGDPAILRDLIAGKHDDDRFLSVPPGHRIALGAGGRLHAEPAP